MFVPCIFLLLDIRINEIILFNTSPFILDKLQERREKLFFDAIPILDVGIANKLHLKTVMDIEI